MSDRDHERSAEICRQAALPVLRQRHDTVVPAGSQSRTDATPTAPAAAQPIPVRDCFDFGVGAWLRLPR
jgi:hypothetical protein